MTLADLVGGKPSEATTLLTARPQDEPGPRSVVLTFDDGLLDNYTRVLPLLVEFGMVGTFYVVPGYDRLTRWVNPWTGRWSDEPRELYSLPYESMKSRHRQEMSRLGMEIGCHTYTHRKLTQVPVAELEREIRGAKAFLEDELGSPVTTFSYPNGRFNQDILGRVRAAGFSAACSTIPGYYRPEGNRFLLNRFLTEDPGFFEAVLLGRAFTPGPLLQLWGRRLRAAV